MACGELNIIDMDNTAQLVEKEKILEKDCRTEGQKIYSDI